jgi:hypothetical protein
MLEQVDNFSYRPSRLWLYWKSLPRLDFFLLSCMVILAYSLALLQPSFSQSSQGSSLWFGPTGSLKLSAGNQPQGSKPSAGHLADKSSRGISDRPQLQRTASGAASAGKLQQISSTPGSIKNRPAQWGEAPPNRPSYQFRTGDQSYLRKVYETHLRSVNRTRRPTFNSGGYFPYGDITYLSPIPANICEHLPTQPVGYQMGYFDGYIVVYDPVTYFLANVVDLLS